jgi:hypothetical protein
VECQADPCALVIAYAATGVHSDEQVGRKKDSTAGIPFPRSDPFVCLLQQIANLAHSYLILLTAYFCLLLLVVRNREEIILPWNVCQSCTGSAVGLDSLFCGASDSFTLYH